MRVEKVKTETISDKIARQIEENILTGGLNKGEKLPSETWRKMWDWALFVSAFLPVFIFVC